MPFSLPDKQRFGLRTWIEIDTGALKTNYDSWRSFLPKGMLMMSVVKSNAYGHGLVGTAKALVSFGTDWLGVDTMLEALRLRKEGIKTPILVLGYTLPELIADAIEENVDITIGSVSALNRAIEAARGSERELHVHIKIDTGMHRQGFLPGEPVAEALSLLQSKPRNFVIAGIYSHFADSDNQKSVERQTAVFTDIVRQFEGAGFSGLLKHIASSGGALVASEQFGLVRIGIGTYGLWPSFIFRSARVRPQLVPALTWRAIIAEVKEVPEGESVGYDYTETLTRRSVLAVCPIGYWHGYPQSLSSQGEVLVRGKRARVVGRVSMDMLTLDVTDIPGVSEDDVVTLIGRDGDEEITAYECAEKAGVTHYEFLTRINPLIKRLYN